MIEGVACILLGFAIGVLVGWLVFKMQLNSKVNDAVAEKARAHAELDKEYTGYKSAAEQKEKTHREQMQSKESELEKLGNELKEKEVKRSALETDSAKYKAERDSFEKQVEAANTSITDLNHKLTAETKLLRKAEQELATASADLKAANDKLDTQKAEIENLQTTMQEKFKNIANEVLDEKSKKFTETNEKNIKALIEPLGRDIEAFKQKVTEESKERFSLGERVKELVDANKTTNEVAVNLTKALKGEAKTQGNWGEMILESILEKSGLRKNEQYFMEHQLTGEDGKPLRSESEDKKMRPDAVIKYPDERHVIVDSKVSLTAYAIAVAATDDQARELALAAHVESIKGHIDGLSAKGYEDYKKSMDFVLMFVPSEAAYGAALQTDPDLWSYAYGKRILLQSPTNLITSLKLIEELWKREAHNVNAKAIAERGRKLYDKFVGFVTNLEAVGANLDTAKAKYTEAHKQLTTGNDNLVLQATKLKSMVVETKKDLPQAMVELAEQTGELSPEDNSG